MKKPTLLNDIFISWTSDLPSGNKYWLIFCITVTWIQNKRDPPEFPYYPEFPNEPYSNDQLKIDRRG